MEGQRVQKTPGSGKKTGLIVGGIAGVLLAAYLGLCFWVGASDTVMPNVSVAGVDVSGMTEQQAQDEVERVLAEYGDDAVVTLNYKNWSGTMRAADFQRERFGGSAVFAGREHFLTQGFQYLRHLLGGSTNLDLDFTVRLEQTELPRLMDEAEQFAGDTVRQMEYRLEGEQLVVTKGAPGVQFRSDWVLYVVTDAVEQALEQAISQQGAANVTVDLEQEEATELTQPDEPKFDAIHDELYAEAAEPVYDKATGTVSDHVVGVNFDVNVLKSVYESAAEGETFSVPLVVTQPRDTKESLEAKLFSDVLGQAASKVSGSANRKTNVKLSAAACDGVILLPGEEFSYNNTTGSRTADKGYLPAPTYNAGASVDDVGGGICQTSSTIYYALLHTTLEVVERANHSYATGYVPDGMDATVFFGVTDFRFKNNTNYPVKIDTESYDKNGNRYLKVTIYGTNEDGRYAVPTNNVFDEVLPDNKYVADETVPRGTLVLDTKQNAYRGRKAQVYRTVYEADGTQVEVQNMGVSRYKMRSNLYHYNPLDGDPATWPNGVPPQPVPDPVPTTPTEPVTPVPDPSTETTPVEPVPPTPEAPAETAPEQTDGEESGVAA